MHFLNSIFWLITFLPMRIHVTSKSLAKVDDAVKRCKKQWVTIKLHHSIFRIRKHKSHILSSPFAMIGFKTVKSKEELETPPKTVSRPRFCTKKTEKIPTAEHTEFAGVAISMEDDYDHVELCKDWSSCPRCFFLRNKESLQEAAPVKFFPGLSWLDARMVNDMWGIGCLICAAANFKTDFGNFCVRSVRKSNLKRHTASPQHQEALNKLNLDHKDTGIKQAPTEEEFQLVLNHRRGVASLSFSVNQVGKRFKLCKMMWCLAEAGREMTREFLKEAGSIALAQDGRKSKLLVRYSACNEVTLVHKKGFLGLEYIDGLQSAAAIVECLEKIIRKFCTRPDTGLDEHLEACIKESCEVLCADAASNEFAAGRLARKGAFSNVVTICKDNAHAATRQEN